MGLINHVCWANTYSDNLTSQQGPIVGGGDLRSIYHQDCLRCLMREEEACNPLSRPDNTRPHHTGSLRLIFHSNCCATGILHYTYPDKVVKAWLRSTELLKGYIIPCYKCFCTPQYYFSRTYMYTHFPYMYFVLKTCIQAITYFKLFYTKNIFPDIQRYTIWSA